MRRLFTLAVRMKLGAALPDEIETKSAGIQVAKRGWNEEPAAISALVELAVSVAQSIAPAIAETAQAEAPPPRSAYRGTAASAEEKQRWQATQQEVAARQADEVAHIAAVRKRRLAEEQTRMLVILGAILAVTVVAWLLAATN